jgi:hypothetical protein
MLLGARELVSRAKMILCPISSSSFGELGVGDLISIECLTLCGLSALGQAVGEAQLDGPAKGGNGCEPPAEGG